MSATVLCQGCGGRVEVPDDHARPRIRCPQCGVMCEVPAGGPPKKAPARPKGRSADAEAEEVLFEDEPAPAPKPPPRKRVEQIQTRPAPKAAPPPDDEPYPLDWSADDDGKPYYVHGIDEERPCPECHKAIPRDAVLCTSCGYNLRTRKKAVQAYEPIDRQWQGGWPFQLRLGLFIGAQCLFLPLMIFGAVRHGNIFGWFFPWFWLTAMLAFLLGTWDHIHLTRNKKGRTRLVKTWHVCFLPRPPLEVDVNAYSGVTCGTRREVGCLDMFILGSLLVSGIIPGLIWAYLVFVRDTYYVALAKDHGYPDLVLYHGSNRELMRDIAETVRDAAHIPCEFA
jgi:hypothetical protein